MIECDVIYYNNMEYNAIYDNSIEHFDNAALHHIKHNTTWLSKALHHTEHTFLQHDVTLPGIREDGVV